MIPLLRRVAPPVGLSLLLLIGASLWAGHRFGSVRCAILFLKGERILVANPLISINDATPGSKHEVAFKIANHSVKPVRIVGSTSSCGCATVQALPFTIEPSSDSMFRVRVVPKDVPSTRVGLRVFTDDPHTPEIALVVETIRPLRDHVDR